MEFDEELLQKEVIDGVTVVHTGVTQYLYDSDGKALPREILKMYDADGNSFYSNCTSLEEAEQMVERLEAEGRTPVIGPKAPVINNDGRPVSNNWENCVGVFIVSPEKEQSNTPRHR